MSLIDSIAMVLSPNYINIETVKYDLNIIYKVSMDIQNSCECRLCDLTFFGY